MDRQDPSRTAAVVTRRRCMRGRLAYVNYTDQILGKGPVSEYSLPEGLSSSMNTNLLNRDDVEYERKQRISNQLVLPSQ